MQKKQLRNSRKSIGKTQKMFEDKNRKKRHSEEENYQEDLQQGNYLDGQIKDMMKNTRQSQKEIGGDRKDKEKEGKEQWR